MLSIKQNHCSMKLISSFSLFLFRRISFIMYNFFFRIIYYFISKYVFKIDLLNTFLQLAGQSLESQKSLILNGSNQILNSQDILDNMRNLMPSILFFRGITLSIIIYLIEIFILRKMKYDGLSEIRFKNFYLPGNAILASLVLYLLIMGISYMKTPLYTDAIFLKDRKSVV